MAIITRKVTPKPGPDPELDDEEILKYIANEYSPAVGTSDVADHFDVTVPGAFNYLKRLEEEGLVDSRKIGQVRVWWLTDRGRREIAPD